MKSISVLGIPAQTIMFTLENGPNEVLQKYLEGVSRNNKTHSFELIGAACTPERVAQIHSLAQAHWNELSVSTRNCYRSTMNTSDIWE